VGKVTSAGDVPLSELVIYLESPDAGRAMSAPVAAVKVSQKGAQFSPALTIISVGQTVEFPNDEDRLIEHNVFSNAPAKRFDLGLYPPGQTRSVTFDKPGAVFLYCSIHRHMDGVIFVSPTPYFSRVDNDGNYRIENVPAGKWVLKTWQRRKRFAEQSVPLDVGTQKAVAANLELRRK
jgi:plastocyanin